ncbi:MAG: M24 family metallopeptidase, partial [bacterium]|nr:M24 family metallopeptidase [bacterium]
MSDPTYRPTCPAGVYRDRRRALAARLQRPLVVGAGFAPARNYATNPHPFRPGSTYLYYGGMPLEDAAWLIEPGSDGDAGCTMFRPAPGPDDAVWFGTLPSDDAIAAAAGVAVSRLADPAGLAAAVGTRKAGVIAPPGAIAQSPFADVGLEPATPDELRAVIDERLCKDQHELTAMRDAARVTVDAHRAAMGATTPGAGEADVAAAFTARLIANQCQPSFTPIATVRGEVLHGQGYPRRLQPGSLMLVDAGAEEPGGYACDVTRTYPVTGSWTAIQRQLYETVQRAQQATIAACVPGRRFREVHDLAGQVICEGLVEAELLRGDPAELAGRYAHTLFFCHGLGHLIGLDVHDMEDFGDLAGYAPGRKRRPEFGNKFLRLDRDLAAGMCLTIEPGLYLVPAIWEHTGLVGPFADAVNRRSVEALLKDNFGGIRIEETICVRQSGGPEVLTEALP